MQDFGHQHHELSYLGSRQWSPDPLWLRLLDVLICEWERNHERWNTNPQIRVEMIGTHNVWVLYHVVSTKSIEGLKWLGVVQMNRYHSRLSPHVPTEFLCLGFFCTTCGKLTTFKQFPGTLETSSRSSTSCSMTLACLGYIQRPTRRLGEFPPN